LGFLGNDGGEALALCDSAFVVPSSETARIQESHITAGHAMLQYIEDKLLDINYLQKS
jgi:D-sedoheptulose 7-phosphate isomerase